MGLGKINRPTWERFRYYLRCPAWLTMSTLGLQLFNWVCCFWGCRPYRGGGSSPEGLIFKGHPCFCLLPVSSGSWLRPWASATLDQRALLSFPHHYGSWLWKAWDRINLSSLRRVGRSVGCSVMVRRKVLAAGFASLRHWVWEPCTTSPYLFPWIHFSIPRVKHAHQYLVTNEQSIHFPLVLLV